MNTKYALTAVFVITLMAAAPHVIAAESDIKVATLVVTGRVWTADRERPWAEAVAVRGERILAVGSRAEIQRLTDDETEVIEAGDGLVVPGLIDSHIHLVDGGLQLTRVQLRSAASRQEFARRIGDYAKKLKPGQWITGGEWDHTLWGGELPSRDWIDAVTPDTPVWINRLDGHMALANTAAMRAARVADDVADVSGGDIVRDAAGRPTGVFKDNAMSLIERAVPEVSLEQQVDATLAAMDYLAQRGVTAVHHMGTWQHLDVFRAAQRRLRRAQSSRGPLKTRIYACVPLNTWERLAKAVREQDFGKLSRAGRGDQWLKIGGLKGFVDGSLGSHTAALLEPFSDAPNDRGLLVNTAEDLEHWTREADTAGLQVAVHAIGDRANRLQLDVFERVAKANGPRDRRFRIEHAQHIAQEDIPRFAKLGVIASMQPYHTIDDGRWAEGVIGRRRSETSYAFRSLLDADARLAFGSDWSVAPPTPIEGIYAAVTRRTLDGKHPNGWIPEQKITLDEALRAYTIDAAYAAFSESDLGSLEPGKLADMVVLDRNLFHVGESLRDSHSELEATRLRDAKIQVTIVGGKVVYRIASALPTTFESREWSDEQDDLFAGESNRGETVLLPIATENAQAGLRIDSAALLYGLAMPALAEAGRTPERMRGRSWLLHAAVILRGHPSGETKGENWFVTPWTTFRMRTTWHPRYVAPDGGQGPSLTIVAKLFFTDPKYVPATAGIPRDQTNEQPGQLVSGGFELEVVKILNDK